MKKTLILILLLTCTLMFAACSQKKMTRVEPSQPATAVAKPKDTATTETTEAKQTISEEKQMPASDIKTTDISKQEERKDFFEFKDVLFDYDKFNIRQDARAALDSTAEWLQKDKNVRVIIEGHCDERGTNEYNLALGERRAKAVRDYLSSLGISSKRMSFVTYGEEKPLCSEQNESCRQKNRRAHFVAAE